MQDLLKKPLSRAILFVAVLVLLIVTPWWVSLPIILFLTVYLPMYLEVLVYSFIFETLYSVRFAFPYTYPTIAVVFLILVTIVRSRIRT